MQWTWRTSHDDGDQNRPYHFRFVIRGVARSNAVEVWLVFGE
jgi:hypothetical protein